MTSRVPVSLINARGPLLDSLDGPASTMTGVSVSVRKGDASTYGKQRERANATVVLRGLGLRLVRDGRVVLVDIGLACKGRGVCEEVDPASDVCVDEAESID